MLCTKQVRAKMGTNQMNIGMSNAPKMISFPPKKEQSPQEKNIQSPEKVVPEFYQPVPEFTKAFKLRKIFDIHNSFSAIFKTSPRVALNFFSREKGHV